MAKVKRKRPADISKEDWDAVDVPELPEEKLRTMRPALDAMPEAVKKSVRRRGPGKKPAKQLVTLRLDPTVIKAFKAGGEGWQSRMNDALADAVKRNIRKKAAKASAHAASKPPSKLAAKR